MVTPRQAWCPASRHPAEPRRGQLTRPSARSHRSALGLPTRQPPHPTDQHTAEPSRREGHASLPPWHLTPPTVSLPTRHVAARDGPHPRVELATTTATPRAASSSPAVPPTCPNHRSAAVIHGQPRSIPMSAELEDQPVRSGPRELPELAVNRALVGAESVLGRSQEDPSGHERSRPICKNRRSEGVHTRLRAAATLLGMQAMSVPSCLNEG